jgi:hypothetical protein
MQEMKLNAALAWGKCSQRPPGLGGVDRFRQKKPSARGRGWEAFLLSHIKAPAQGGKAGGSKLPGREFIK